MDSMTARWLLPVMTLIVASASGSILGGAIQVYSQLHSFQTLLVSVFMVSVGFTLALMIFTIYLMRLFLHGLLSDANVLSVFLPIGPTSQSGYTILFPQTLTVSVPLAEFQYFQLQFNRNGC